MAKAIWMGSAPPDDPVYNKVWFFSVPASRKSTSASPTNTDGTEAKPSSRADKEQDKK